MANVVLVTDMVVGFMEDGHNLYCGDEAREIIPKVQRLIETEQAAGGSVIFICDTHDPDDLEFEMFPVHCVRGTEEPEIIPELREYEGIHLPKRRYSAFFETNLADLLAELEPERVIVCGSAPTSVSCILSRTRATAITLWMFLRIAWRLSTQRRMRTHCSIWRGYWARACCRPRSNNASANTLLLANTLAILNPGR